MNKLLLFLALFLLPCTLHAANIEKIVIGEGEHRLGDDTTPDAAMRTAKEKARVHALEQTGIIIHADSTMFYGEMISEIINSSAKGLIVSEKVLDGTKCSERDGILFCKARIEAHILPLHSELRSRNRLDVSVQRYDKVTPAKSLIFQDNDEVRIKVTPAEDSYLSIFSVDNNSNVIKLYPNEYSPARKTSAKKEFIFPDESLKSKGVKLKATVPANKQKAVEVVLVIATRHEEHLLESKSLQNPTLSDLMKELSELIIEDPSSWVQKTIGYEVRR